MRPVAAALLAALAVAGCGFESGKKADKPSKERVALTRAATITPRAGTARVAYRVRSLPRGRVNLRATGLARLDRGQGRYDLLLVSFPGLPPDTRAEVRAARGVTYLRPLGTKRYSVLASDAAIPTSIGDVLPYLRAITGPIRSAGRGNVRGEETDVLKATVDLDLVDEGLPPDQQAGYRVQVDRFVTSKVPVTIHLDEKGRLRRLAYRVRRLVRPGPGEDRGIAYVADLYDYGAKGDTAPPPRRLIDRE